MRSHYYRLRIHIILSTLLVLCSCSIYRHIASYAIIQPQRCDDEVNRKHFPQGITPAEYHLKSQRFRVTVRDSLKLVGWFVYANRDSAEGTMILVHGLSSCKEHLVGSAKFLSDAGYQVILFDLPAHGKSEGKYTTFGYYEQQDISTLLDSMIAWFHIDESIGIYGNSLGGAIALQAMANDPRIECGIIESTFATLEEIIYDYLKRYTWLLTRSTAKKTLEKAARLAQFDSEAVKPEESAKRIIQPVLLAHGSADKRISIRYGRRIFKNLASRKKEWYEISGAGHYDLWQMGGQAYKAKLLAFLSKSLN